MSARWWTLLVWALAAASATFWGFRLWVHAPQAPPHALTASASPVLRGDLTRLLGADAPPPPPMAVPEPVADARFQLIGVVSPRSSRAAGEGLALIAVDGNAPKAFRVGAAVDGQIVLQAVNARGATLGPRDGAAAVALNLAPPAPAATGVLPAGGAPGAAPFNGGAGQAGPLRVMPPVRVPPRLPPVPPQRRPLPGTQDVDEAQQQQGVSAPDNSLTR